MMLESQSILNTNIGEGVGIGFRSTVQGLLPSQWSEKHVVLEIKPGAWNAKHKLIPLSTLSLVHISTFQEPISLKSEGL